MSKNFYVAATFTSILSAVIILSGCGKGPESEQPAAPAALPAATTSVPAPAPVTACPAGQFPFQFGCTTVSDFNYACMSAGGVVNSGVCRLQFSLLGWNAFYPFMSYSTMSYFPRLTPSDTTGFGAFDFGFQVFEHDHLSFEATGGWGSLQTHATTLLGFIPAYTTSMNCSQVDLNGKPTNSDSVPDNAGAAPGLMATDGTEVFALGSHLEKDMSHHGSLKIGFNTPDFQSGCYQISLRRLTITRCINTSGGTVACQ